MAGILIVVPGEPIAQGRPKFSTKNGVFRTYDPPDSMDYKETVAVCARLSMARKQMLEGALALSVKVYRSVPTSWSEKRKQMAYAGQLRPVTKPDTDNYVKGALDALEGIVFKNDSQVVEYRQPFGKWYSEKPRLEIELKEIGDEI
jgi:Holliday junction resolvase RusA-like endonuclease